MSPTIQPDQAVWLLGAFCRLHRLPCDLQAVGRECVPPMQMDDLIRLADQLGLCLEPVARELHAEDLGQGAMIRCARSSQANGVEAGKKAEATDASGSQDGQSRDEHDWLIAVPSTQGLAVQRCGEASPTHSTIEKLNALQPDIVLVVKLKQPVARDPDSAKSTDRSFGFRWFVPELLKHRAVWREVLLASLVLQLLALAFPLFTQAIIDKVVVHRTESTLIALGIGMAVFIVFTAALGWVRQYLILHTGNRVDAVLGTHVFDHLFRLPILYFQHRPTGVIAARLQGIETIREFVSSAAVTLMLDLPFLLIFVGIMFWYSVPLTMVVLAILALIVGASALVAPLFQRRLNEQFLRGAANQAFLTEYVTGIETVKSLQLEPHVNHRYRTLLAASLGASFKTRQLGNAYGTAASALEQLMNLLILVVGAWLVMTTASFTVGMLVAFQMFRLAQTRMLSGRGAIQIEGLGFRYSDDLPLLYDDFNLQVGGGQLVAIMGPSGAGKSTLAKLLQGFYPPSCGSIRIDDIDIRNLSVNELRSHFGVVPQETTLFSGTLLDNLRIANSFASFDQVVAACKMAEIHGAIEALPNGYQTEIGERGVGLSGGQRQRIAIARALIKGPKVLVFDEATSSVDAPTAEQLGRTINALKGRATIVFIAHALPKSLQPDSVVRIGEKLSAIPSPGRSSVETHAAGSSV